MSLFSIRLRQLRTAKGETQEKVAEFLDVARATYSGYERGVIVPPYDKAKKLADRYEVNIDYLMGRSNDPVKGVSSYEKEIDISKSLLLLSDMLCDDESDIKYNGKSLSNKQKEDILPIITNIKKMIDLVTKYE